MKQTKGFTLIELLVVIAIIGILAVFTLAFLAPARQKGRDAKRKQDLNAVAKALELFYSDQNHYVAVAADTISTAGWTDLGDGAVDDNITPTYINVLPTEPAPVQGYSYGTGEIAGSPQGYGLGVTLENAQDSQDGDTGTAGAQFRLCGGTFSDDCSS